jgi:hypothetical protein
LIQIVIYNYTGHTTGNEAGIPPWTSMLQKPGDYFDPDQVPDGFKMLEPSKMKDPEIQALLDFWHQKQVDGNDGIGFRFREAEPSGAMKTSKRVSSSSARPQKSEMMKGKTKVTKKLKKYGMEQTSEYPTGKTRAAQQACDSDSSGEHFDFGGIDDGEDSAQDEGTENDRSHAQPPSSRLKLADTKGKPHNITGTCRHRHSDYP